MQLQFFKNSIISYIFKFSFNWKLLNKTFDNQFLLTSILLRTALIFLFFSGYLKGQDLLINEFLSDNENSIMDYEGDHVDWIELYNSSGQIIDLKNYFLSDEKENLLKFRLPSITLQAKEYIIIFASDKDQIISEEIHSNFKIKAKGESLFLSNTAGSIVDFTDPVELKADQAYARIPNGSDQWLKTDIPSPGSVNFLDNQLFFSHDSGFYEDVITLNITSNEPHKIYYTTDGSLPSINSLRLEQPIHLENKNNEPNFFSTISTTPKQELISYTAWHNPVKKVDKAHILRFASYENGIQTSKVYTKTFFIEENMDQKYTIPVISLITEQKHFFSEESGIYVPGTHYNTNNPEWSGNYFQKGKEWERPIYIEYFSPKGNLLLAQNAGVRIHGGKTRHAAQKSLRLYARKEYGNQYFNYPLFVNKTVDKFKSFIIRSSMGSWYGQTIIKDDVAQKICDTLNVDHQEAQPVIVYLNGEYWGIHTLKDRLDEHYISNTHNLHPDSIEIFDWTNESYFEIIDFLNSNSLDNEVNYAYVKDRIDIDNFIDYQIAEQFFTNYDWPDNNFKIWRPKTSGGKWRWMLFDLDAGFRNADYNMLIHSTNDNPNTTWPNSAFSTLIFRSLIQNETFIRVFTSRYHELLTTTFQSQSTISHLNDIKNQYEPEIDKHIRRWQYPDNKSKWISDINSQLSDYLLKRPCLVESHLNDFFSINLDIDCNGKNTDNISISHNPNNGIFYLKNNGLDIENAKLAIYNMSGQIVYMINHFNLPHKQSFDINISQLLSASYILTIENANRLESKRILIFTQ